MLLARCYVFFPAVLRLRLRVEAGLGAAFAGRWPVPWERFPLSFIPCFAWSRQRRAAVGVTSSSNSSHSQQ